MSDKIEKCDVLILSETNEDDWAYNAWKENGINAGIIFVKVNKLLRFIRRIWFWLGLPFRSIWYDRSWIADAKKAKLIIFHVTYLTLYLGKDLNDINSDCRIIAWYWDKVYNCTNPKNLKGNIEKWSFDLEDCKKYNLKYNHQYYFNSLVKNSEKILWDVYFCGSDSGRGREIIKTYNELKKLGFRLRFKIVNPKFIEIPEILKSKYVNYNQIREDIAKSVAILEIVRNGQSGLTIRAMEALFFEKKLITNNKFIKKEVFYNKNRIFLLGEDNINCLDRFLKCEIDNSGLEYKKNYELDNWLHCFGRSI